MTEKVMDKLLDAVFYAGPIYARPYASHVARWSIDVGKRALNAFYNDPAFRAAYRARGGRFNMEYNG